MTTRTSLIDSAPYENEVPAESILPFHTAAEIATRAPADVPWVAKPWVAERAITEVVGKPKSAGKTTWVMGMLRAVLDGNEFLGERTAKTSVVYLTEERDSTLREALSRAGLLEREDLHILQWRDTLNPPLPWADVVRVAVEKCDDVGARVLVVDTVSQFAGLGGDSENHSGDVLETYRPLQEAASNGLAVISVRHERKSGGDVANAGRGSSAFTGAADIVLLVRRPEGNHRNTVREIHALSRFDDTPDLLAIELTDDGYVALGDSAAVANREARVALLKVAPTNESEAMTLEDLTERANIKRTSAQEALEELCGAGVLRRIGKGVKNNPLRWFKADIHAAGTHGIGAAETIVGGDGADRPRRSLRDASRGAPIDGEEDQK
jgi:hypothetical protein